MFNLYQYSHNKLLARQQGKQLKVMQTFWNKHETLKNQAIVKRKARLDDFIDSQITAIEPFVIPDEYMQRSVPSHESTLQHKAEGANTSLNRFMTKSNKPTHNNACAFKQNAEEFRVTQMDSRYLAPIPSYNFKEQQRTSYSSMKFNEKAERLLNRYESNKARYNNVAYLNRDRYRLCRPQDFKDRPDSGQTHSKSQTQPLHVKRQENPESPSMRFSEIGQARSKEKTYFKLAKTQQLFTTDSMKKLQLSSLLGRSHYNRIKNIKNQTCSTQLGQLSGWSSLRSRQLASSVVI